MKRFLPFVILLLAGPVSGQTLFEDLEQCISAVKLNNPGLQSESLNQQLSETRLKSAWASVLPQVRAFGSFDNNISLPVQLVPAQFLGGQEGKFAEVKFGTRYNASYGVEASLALINVSNWKSISGAALSQKASEYQLQDRNLSISEQAATAYYFALLSREALAMSIDLVNATDSLLQAAKVRLDNGLIEPMEYNRVRAVYLESLQQKTSSEGALQKNINTLKSLCGLASADTIILSENILQHVVSTGTAELGINATSLPRYRMLSYKKLQAAEDFKKQRARILPEVSVFARYTRQSFSNQTDLFSSGHPWYEIGVAGVRAEWSLFSGFNRQANIRQASLQSQIAEKEFENFSLQADKEIEELRINHQVASEAVQRYNEHYVLSNQNYQIAGAKYTEGVYSIDQYVNIYQELVRSQNQYLSNLASFLVYESIITTRNTLK
jgi:outer membrane protein TolC